MLRQASFYALNIICSKCNIERVDGLVGAKCYVQVEGRKMFLARTICQKGNATAIPLIFDLLLIAGVGIGFG